MSRVGAPIKDGIPATALLRGFAETGTTISSPNTGPEAPVYRLDLLVSPPSAPPFETQIKQPIPRIVPPFFLPGIQLPVDIDPKDPTRVKVAFGRYEPGPTTFPGAMGGQGGVTVSFAGGPPMAGMADVFPGCPPADRDDPIWMLTLSVSLPGQPAFPAMVGHRVPRERVADVVPGLLVPVAVDLADKHGKVAVDWDGVR